MCDILFYLGAGNVWYKKRKLTKIQQYIYNIYATIINIYIFGNCINIFLANLRSDLTSKEKNDLVQFMMAFSSLGIKLVVWYAMKNRIKILLRRFFEEKREFARLDLDVESVKKAKMYCITVVLIVYLTITSGTVDGIMTHFKEGMYFVFQNEHIKIIQS